MRQEGTEKKLQRGKERGRGTGLILIVSKKQVSKVKLEEGRRDEWAEQCSNTAAKCVLHN